ncbi:hypothetical protein [Brevibacterium moorei]|uniref:hypothetical protein n=1 Tax=Brevibacterium moorei TaxID=2968457 RepID=UPI00211BCEAA|nr:hypothetical protein [Brevibacterium sp. 68QC2CO]MCQ9386244.1 hypothetical protein [Brevibacterium sp. 68QC2CO]
MSWVQVRGGAGSVSARLDDLDAVADLLGDVASELSGLAKRAAWADLNPLEDLSAIASPGTFARVQAAKSTFTAHSAGLAADFVSLAGSLRLTARAYRDAESLVDGLIDRALRGLGNLAGHAARVVLPVVGINLAVPLVVGGIGIGMAAGAVITGLSFVGGTFEPEVAKSLIRVGAKGVGAVAGAAGKGLEPVGGVAGIWLRDTAARHPGATRTLIENLLPGFVNGFVGLPPGVELGPDGGPGGILPHDSRTLTALAVATARRMGLLGDTGVRVDKVYDDSRAGAMVDAVGAGAAAGIAAGAVAGGSGVGRIAGAGPASGAAGPASAGGAGGATGAGGTRAPGNARELFNRSRATNPEGVDNGRVRVEEYRGADGRKRFIVYLPGTTEWSARPARAGSDLKTNAQGVLGRDTAMHKAVRTALRDSGAGRDDQILLTGFSQGGIIAQSLASDPEFAGDYDVRGVLTAGSPTSDFAPADAKVLAVEHSDDIVPNLDGDRNPDAANWTTLTVERDGEAAGDPGSSHSRDEYERSLERLREAGQQDLADWEEDMGGFFTGERVATRDYEAVRTPG